MTMHLAAFYQSVNPAGALTQIDAVPDQAISTNNVNLVVPSAVNNLLGEVALSASTGPLYGQVQSPSLRQLANQDVLPILAAVTFGGNPIGSYHFMNPRQLVANESLNFAINATGGAAAANYGLVFLGDGAVKPTTGNMFTVRATGAAALAAGTWVNTPLTFDESLPSGTYQVVGFRAVGTNLVAARMVFLGSGWCPGVPAQNAVGDRDWDYGRYGALGVFGQFDVNQPPTVDCLGVTDTAQTFVLDLIKSQ